ncbi:MAG: phthalate 4,5-dioxygenase [Chloroflexota bacterium]|jgi:phthalate 4,5-dioxygenase oxygenase subunit|nr:phthalate 4,5-dioxygenase [Chloroflexota bacterium]
MLSKEENELLTRVGPGSRMGEMLRRYWLPACLAEEIPAPDCDPVRVRLLGEDLVVFRDSNGRVGLVKENCAHRGASLFLGRNEEGGLRCLYHGWKCDVEGRILDMPCEPGGSTFKDRVRQPAYPVREAGDIVWAYMGPLEKMPELPTFEWMLVPSTQRSIAKMRAECNYAQSLEGTLDYAHATVLHSGWAVMGTWQYDEWHRPTRDTAPRHEIEDTSWGFRYAAISTHFEEPDQKKYIQAKCFALPFHSILGSMIHLFVPMDDEHTWNYNIFFDRKKELDHAEHLRRRHQVIGVDLNPDRTRVQTLANNFLQDRALMREKRSYSGILGSGPNQDMAVLESMKPIYDRTEEHLAASDEAVIHWRRYVLDALDAFEEGADPPGTQPGLHFAELCGIDTVLPIDAPWQEAYARVQQLEAVYAGR